MADEGVTGVYRTFSTSLVTPSGKTSELTVRYETTPKNCVATPTFYRQPGLQKFTVTIK